MSEPVEVLPVVDVSRLTQCTAEGCSGTLMCRGLCKRCYSRQWKAHRREQRRAERVAELGALRSWVDTEPAV